MIQELQLRVLPEVAADSDQLRRYLANEKGLALSALKGVRVLKRSIDARQRTIYVNLKVRLYVNELPADDAFVRTNYNDVSEGQQVIVVGAGPGGLFAALRLIELGLRPIVLERGKDVHERKKDLALIHIAMVSSIPAPKSVAIRTRSSTCFVSMVPQQLSWLMPIPTSALTDCRK